MSLLNQMALLAASVTLSSGTAVGYTPMGAEITTAGDAFTFSESFIEGDDVTSGTTVTSGVVPSLPMLGSTTTTAGGLGRQLGWNNRYGWCDDDHGWWGRNYGHRTTRQRGHCALRCITFAIRLY